MTATQYGVRFPIWGDRRMPNEHIARHVARVSGNPVIRREVGVSEWSEA